MVEGSNPSVKRDPKHGLDLLEEAMAHGSIEALEFRTYHEVRFANDPDMGRLVR